MKRLAWTTDLHLNFLSAEAIVAFCGTIAEQRPDALLISGDIAESHNLQPILLLLREHVPCPIYFVLGNHDYYRGSIPAVRASVTSLCQEHAGLCWLPAAGVVPLSERTALVGHDGWADGRSGDFFTSTVVMNDYHLIRELAGIPTDERFRRLNQLGDEAAEFLRRQLEAALPRYRHVLVVIHTPPFTEACIYQGRVSSANWLPHLTCTAAGQMLRELLGARPENQVTVLCGHTHGQADLQILPNLRIRVGPAEYRSPKIQDVFEAP